MTSWLSPRAAPARIHGTVAPGFESVREMFESNFARRAERQAQLCAFVGNENVVDLWGSAEEEEEEEEGYTADSLAVVFSTSKNLTAVVMAKMVEKGLVRYEDRIADHWPEFGAEEATVADLMRHEAGLATFRAWPGPEDIQRGGIKANRVGRIVEQEVQDYLEGYRREYHSLSRGWIANELVRRADPEGRTIGEVLRDEVSGPLHADAYIGLADSELRRVAPYTTESALGSAWRVLLDTARGRRVEPDPATALGHLFNVVRFRWRKGRRDVPPSCPAGVLNAKVLLTGEIPSANACCSARGLAAVGAAMANRGRLGGLQVLGEEAWEQMHAEPAEDVMTYLGRTNFTRGGVNLFRTPSRPSGFEAGLNRQREGAYGWNGLGGSSMLWNPATKIGFAYVPTFCIPYDLFNSRAGFLYEEVVRCAWARERGSGTQARSS